MVLIGTRIWGPCECFCTFPLCTLFVSFFFAPYLFVSYLLTPSFLWSPSSLPSSSHLLFSHPPSLLSSLCSFFLYFLFPDAVLVLIWLLGDVSGGVADFVWLDAYGKVDILFNGKTKRKIFFIQSWTLSAIKYIIQ